MVITETWLHPDIHDSEVAPVAYSLLRTDRDGRGGGVALVIKNSVLFHKHEGIPGHESIWCTVNVCGMSILIGGVYRRPNASVEYMMQLHDFLHTKVNARTKLILTGDFNLAGIDWDNLTFGAREKESCDQLLKIMFSFSLSQLVNHPTRQQGGVASVLDLAFVWNTFEPEISIEDGISDHKMILLTFPGLTSQAGHQDHPYTDFKDYSRADDVSIIDYLETVFEDFTLLPSYDVNGLWEKFKGAIKH